MTDAERYRLTLNSSINRTNLDLDKLYTSAEFQLVNAVINFEIDDYELSKNPVLKKRIEEIIQKLNSSATDIIIAGVESSWALSNEKNDKLVRSIFKNKDEEIPEKYLSKSNAQNKDALSAFIDRKTNGLDLSDNVWKYNDGYKTQIENALQVGIGNGISANDMSKYLTKYLQNPTAAAAEYDEKNISAEIPQSRKGQPGVYSSPKKNAMRLARTEINMAYDTADYNRYQNLDFVVGYEVHTSGNHTTKSKGKIIKINDICDKLAGEYPKDFKFTGWHPQCRCYVTAILKTDEEQDKEDLAILRGDDPDKKESKNTVKDVPDGFKKWVEDNKERLEESSSLPYFVRDNKDYFSGIDFRKKVQKQFEEDEDLLNIIQGTTSVSKKLTAKEILAKKHAQRTDAEKAEIISRWNVRKADNSLTQLKSYKSDSDIYNNILQQINQVIIKGKTQTLSDTEIDELKSLIEEAEKKEDSLTKIFADAKNRHYARTPMQIRKIKEDWKNRMYKINSFMTLANMADYISIPKSLEHLKEIQDFYEDKYIHDYPKNYKNKDIIEQTMKNMFDKYDFGINIRAEKLLKVFESGKFKNIFEVKEKGEAYRDARRSVEETMFGIKDIEDSERPIYGALKDKNKLESIINTKKRFNKGGSEYQYGDIEVRLHKNIPTTWTSTDTYGCTFDARPSLVNNPKFLSQKGDQIFTKDFNDFNEFIEENAIDYIELQYHGGVKVEDIESITFDTEPLDDNLKVAEKAYSLGIKVYYINEYDELVEF